MEVVDITMGVSPQIPTFPGSPKPQFIEWDKIHTTGYNMEMIFLSTHTGTHLDAPYHFAENGSRIDQIPPRRLVGRAHLIEPAGFNIEVEDVVRFEQENGSLSGTTLIFHTGWSDRIAHPRYFEENPGLEADAASYIVSKGVNLVGIDSPSIDPGHLGDFAAHRILAAGDVLILENLTNLDRIRNACFDLIALPLKLEGATGSPVRAVAVSVEDDESAGAA